MLPLGALIDGEESVRDVLKKKHPTGKTPQPDTLLTNDNPVHTLVHPSFLRELMGTHGGAGPSALDASGWRHLCTSFGTASNELCNALALFAWRLCTEVVDFDNLQAYVACRLIPLDKRPGVRPIGICEVARRIIGKAFLTVISGDIQQAMGTLQLCAGQIAGIEAAIHAMRRLYESDNTEAVLLADAENAFNILNRRAALHNIGILCPALSTILQNTYGGTSNLFVGGEALASDEGTTQGDPLALSMYAVGIMPLLHELQSTGTKQVWYADDATGGGTLTEVRSWWDKLTSKGPGYGYHPKASKSWLLVKEAAGEEAKRVLSGTGVRITTEGKRPLRLAIGSSEFKEIFYKTTISPLVKQISRLAKVAQTQPQAAYAAFTHGVIRKRTFLT